MEFRQKELENLKGKLVVIKHYTKKKILNTIVANIIAINPKKLFINIPCTEEDYVVILDYKKIESISEDIERYREDYLCEEG